MGTGESMSIRIPKWMACVGILVLASATSATAQERVGEAVKINTAVIGVEGEKTEGDAVYRDELVRANATGLGQFEFHDGTRLAVGPNASVVIDKYVLGAGGTVKKLTIRATKGTFRFIGGRSPPGAYTILTPAGTLGIRGTADEVQILEDGRVIIVHLEGESEFCFDEKDLALREDTIAITPTADMPVSDRVNCRVLSNPCDFIIADKKKRTISEPKPVSDAAVDPDTFPILRDDKELVGGFKLNVFGCGLAQASASAASPALAAALVGAGIIGAIVVISNTKDDDDEPATAP